MKPQARVGLARLTNMAFQGEDLDPLRSQLLIKSLNGKDSAGALMDLSVIDQLQGHRERGLAFQAQAVETCKIFRTDRGRRGQKKLLVFALPTDIGGNTPIEFLVPSAEYDILTYYIDTTSRGEDGFALPAHDVAFCAAPADAAEAEAFHDRVRHLTRRSGKPVLNLGCGTVKLDRDHLQLQVRDCAGIRMPRTLRLDRDAVLGQTTLGYPLVIRPVGSHAGHGLAKIDDINGLAAYLSGRPEAEFHLSDFIDYASAGDGLHRKYRIVFVDGRAFPCHMAIADQWDIWYLNAEMEQSPDKRAEEAAFMDGFDSAFATRHAGAFAQIAERIGLEYFGIDCAEDRDGNLVIFEADNSLIVHDMDCKSTFPYKGLHMRRIFAAFKAMLQAAQDRAA